MKAELTLDFDQIDHIKDALVVYIDYLRNGDEDEKALAKRVENTYNEVTKQESKAWTQE